VYFQTKGQTALSYSNKELVGHSVLDHPEGFGSPLGKLKGINLAIENMSPRDLMAYDIYENQQVCLAFEGGIKVEGTIITGSRNLQGKILLISFKDCKVTHGDTILFKPEWGQYDMAVGKSVISGYSGPADLSSFDLITHQVSSTTIKTEKTADRLELESLYKQVRDFREGHVKNLEAKHILKTLQDKFSKDWLLGVELYEQVTKTNDRELKTKILNQLHEIKLNRPEVSHLIEDGIEIADAS
jgi:phenylalanine-4-hydroxylase